MTIQVLQRDGRQEPRKQGSAGDVSALWTSQGVPVISVSAEQTPAEDDEELRESHLFVLFLVQYRNSVEAAAAHMQWVRARFTSVPQWLGDVRNEWRSRSG